MRQAIVSDIHGNEVALQAVMADIDGQEVDEILCLGDVVGYGPRPRECLRVGFDYKFTLMGNHEEAVLFAPIGFNEKARKAIDWTKEQLLSVHSSRSEERAGEERRVWDFMGSLRKSKQEGEFCYVHGSPRDPTREYVFSHDRFDKAKMDEIFGCFEGRVCFFGHTHIPGVFEEGYTFDTPQQLDHIYRLGAKKALVNVGSVGQPRDGDPRACYVIFDHETVRFRRVSYDVEKTIDQYKGTSLPEYLSRRLREGK